MNLLQGWLVCLFLKQTPQDLDFGLFIQRLRKELEEPPGWKAQYEMAPELRTKPDENAPYYQNARLGAVLILFYPGKKGIQTVMIERPKYEGVHSGQIAFPGGKKEDDDANLISTALREAYEEVNIDPIKVEVLNTLTELYIPPSNFLVTPVVGFTLQRPDFIPETKEVANILEVPVDLLTNDKIRGMKTVTPRENISFETPYYDVNGHTVWGATAMMVSELNAALKQIY